MIIGIPKEVKDHEYRVAATPEGVREAVGAGHRVVVQASAGVGSAIADERVRGGRRGDPARRRRRVRRRRPDREGEGASGVRVRAVPRGPAALHLPASGGRRASHAVPRRAARPLGGVRDRDAPRRPAAAARPDVRDRRPDGPAGGRRGARARPRGPRGADGRRLGGRPGERRGAGRRDGRRERGPDRRRHGGRRDRRGPQRRPAPRHRPDLAGPDPHRDELDAGDRAPRARGRPGRGRRADPGGQGAAPRDGRAGLADAAGRGARRHLDRPGRLLRDLARHDALRPDVRRRRGRPLLRREHAGRRARAPRRTP